MKTTWHCALLFVVSATLSSNADSAKAEKQPWQWSTEERIAARLDTDAAKKRVAALARRGDPPADYIQGRTHPELFFPHEILTIFLRSAYGADDEVGLGFRASASEGAVAAGLPNDFIATLEREAAVLIELQTQDGALRDAMSAGTSNATMLNAQLVDLEAKQCSERAALLTKLRQSYGDRVDRFLYVALAPEMSRVVIGPLKSAHELRQAERGCR